MYIQKSEIPMNPAFPFSIKKEVLKREDNQPDTFHWHTCFEITYVLSGRGKYHVNGTLYTLEKGDVIIFNNVEPHSWEIESEEMNLLVSVFQTELIANGFALLDYDYLMPFIQRGSNFKNKLDCDDPFTQKIIECLLEIYAESSLKPLGYELMTKAHILKVLTLLIRSFQDDTKSDALLEDKLLLMKRLSNVFEYINQNYTRKLTLSEAADQAYMSPSYFSAYFKKVTGTTFTDYINHMRIKHAQELMNTTDLSILNIAMKCGFQNMSNFYRIYKKFTGSKPGSYKQQS